MQWKKQYLSPSKGQITDRFSKAVEQLGYPDRLAVRLGGIFALDRIAKDSENDCQTVMEVLTAFVRNNRPLYPLTDQKDEEQTEKKPKEQIPADIQAALTVIGRRKMEYDKGYQINLIRADLSAANLNEVKNLTPKQLKSAKTYEGAILDEELRNALKEGESTRL